MKTQVDKKSNLDLLIQQIDEGLMKLGLEPMEEKTNNQDYKVLLRKPLTQTEREKRLESMKRLAMNMGKTEEEAEAMVNNPF